MRLDPKLIQEVGEIKKIVDVIDGEVVQWILRIGEAQQMLQNSILNFREIRRTLDEIAQQIPRFHKQPALFAETKSQIESMIIALYNVSNGLKFDQTKCTEIPDLEDENDHL